MQTYHKMDAEKKKSNRDNYNIRAPKVRQSLAPRVARINVKLHWYIQGID